MLYNTLLASQVCMSNYRLYWCGANALCSSAVRKILNKCLYFDFPSGYTWEVMCVIMNTVRLFVCGLGNGISCCVCGTEVVSESTG